MKIEFQTPYGKVAENLLILIRSELVKLTHVQKKISRAEVILREDMHNKVCVINLNIQGASLFVRSCTENFEQSVITAIKDIKRLVNQQLKHKNLPD